MVLSFCFKDDLKSWIETVTKIKFNSKSFEVHRALKDSNEINRFIEGSPQGLPLPESSQKLLDWLSKQSSKVLVRELLIKLSEESLPYQYGFIGIEELFKSIEKLYQLELIDLICESGNIYCIAKKVSEREANIIK